jgi:hypothetical protein
VTQADAAAILGGSAPSPDRMQTGPFQSCSYYATLTSFVQFQVCSGCLSASQFESTVRSGADTLETTLEPVSGVGDQAFWFGDGILWVRKGSVTFNVWVSTARFYGPSGALEGDALKGVALPVARDLAMKVVSRLP